MRSNAGFVAVFLARLLLEAHAYFGQKEGVRKKLKDAAMCPAACASCKPGGVAVGGTPLGASGKCEWYCSHLGYCGKTAAYHFHSCLGCTPAGAARRRRASNTIVEFWHRMHTGLPPPGKWFHISDAECRQLRNVTNQFQLIVVFSLARSAGTTLTQEIAEEVGGQYMDELFNNAVPLSRHSGGLKFEHNQGRPASLLVELLRKLQRPVVFKLNDPVQMPLPVLSRLARCANWCPVVLERLNVHDRWCSWVRAMKTGWWGTRRPNRIEMPCPHVFGSVTFPAFRARHNRWYYSLRQLLPGSSLFVTFDDVINNTSNVRSDVRRFCAHHVQRMHPSWPM